MADLCLLHNAAPAPDSSGLTRSLFQSRAFFDLHAADRGAYFEWVQGERAVASVHFTPVSDGLWRSPARGTSAGYAVAAGLALEDVGAFHDAVERRLAAEGARQLEVLPAPMAHDPVAFANQLYLLRSRGYAISQCDLQRHIAVR